MPIRLGQLNAIGHLGPSTIPTGTGVQKAFIDSNLNSVVFFNFMMGIYTLVYFGTMYINYKAKARSTGRSQPPMIIAALTALYTLCLGISSVEWAFLRWTVVDVGDTRANIFVATVSEPGWANLTLFLLNGLMFIVSDALLIWRCFQLWNKSWRIISFPLFLTISETVLVIPVSFFAVRDTPTTFNTFAAGLLFITVGSTLTTTSLIIYRLYHLTSNVTGAHAKRHFTRILRLIVESAAAYATMIITNAVAAILQTTTTVDTVGLRLSVYYLQPLLLISAGLAPTILVARLITTDAEDTHIVSTSVSGPITHISMIQFQNPRSPQTTTTLPSSAETDPNDAQETKGRTLDIETGVDTVQERE